jgi:hypothetical protein
MPFPEADTGRIHSIRDAVVVTSQATRAAVFEPSARFGQVADALSRAENWRLHRQLGNARHSAQAVGNELRCVSNFAVDVD